MGTTAAGTIRLETPIPTGTTPLPTTMVVGTSRAIMATRTRAWMTMETPVGAVETAMTARMGTPTGIPTTTQGAAVDPMTAAAAGAMGGMATTMRVGVMTRRRALQVS